MKKLKPFVLSAWALMWWPAGHICALDLSLHKTVSKSMLAEDLLLHYTITVSNVSGVVGNNIEVTDLLPAGVSFESAGDPAYTPSNGVWAIGTLTNGASTTLVIGARADFLSGGSSLTNTALLTQSIPADTNPANNEASARIDVATPSGCLPRQFSSLGFFFIFNPFVNTNRAVVLEDVNQDGSVDAIIGLVDQANRVYLNQGNGSFTDTMQMLGLNHTHDLTVGDLDGDGDMDLFESNGENEPNRIFLNAGGTFLDSGQMLGALSSMETALGDLDGDNDLDAVVANTNGQPNTVWLNDGNGVFMNSLQDLGMQNSFAVELGDLDGDGDLDAFFANNGQPNTVWLNMGNGTFIDSGQALGLGNSADVALGDLNGNGRLDALITNEGGADRVWFNNGAGTFAAGAQMLAASTSRGVALGDLDNDGDLDAGVGAMGVSSFFYINDGTGMFSMLTPTNPISPFNNYHVAMKDVDGDGDLDFLASGNPGRPDMWYNNVGLDLCLTKTANRPTPVEGQLVTFTLVASNKSDCVAFSPFVSESLPTGMTFVSASSPDYDPGMATWTLDNLPPNGSTSILIRATVDVGTFGSTLTNGAAIFAGPGDVEINPANNTATVTVAVQPSADLELTKTGTNNTNMVFYTIAVTNLGLNPAFDSGLTDWPDTNTTFNPGLSDPGWIDTGSNLIYDLGDLPGNGGSLTISLVVDVNGGFSGMLTNTAMAVATNSVDEFPSNNVDTHVSDVTATADNDGDGIPDLIDPDDDNDCMPDVWEILFAAAGLNPLVSNSPLTDFDGDGLTDVGEYQAGTDPLDPGSVLQFTLVRTNASGIFLEWTAGTNTTQYVEKAQSLYPPSNTWTVFGVFMPPNPLTNSITDGNATNGRSYYRVRIE